MSKFVVGEIAVVSFSVWPEFPVGTEVEILQVRDDALVVGNRAYQYLVYDDGFKRVWAGDDCLRKKKPPAGDQKREELGSWDLCPWRPESETRGLKS